MASARLAHIPLNLPAFKGLNKQSGGAILGPEWATRLQNTVIDGNNRLASRKGWNNQTVTPAGADVVQVAEFLVSGSMQLVASLDDNTMVKSTDEGQTWTDISGVATLTDANVQFIVFNNVLLAFQDNGVVVKYTGTGNFADLAATNEPDRSVATVNSGRVWAKDTATTIKYCALLDETDWNGADTGSIDMTSIWNTQDEITALADFNNSLVVFSKRNIVLFNDGQGNVLGIDPIQAVVVDTINGIGCIARDSVVPVKGDLWFLDDTGVHSLGRLVQQAGSNPLQNVSLNVQDELKRYVDGASVANIRAVYSPSDRFYLISIPLGTGLVEVGASFVFDTRFALEDGSFRCVGIWNSYVPTAAVLREDLSWWSSRRQNLGEIGKYDGYEDDGGTYVMEYESPWNDYGSPSLKMLKRLCMLMQNLAEQPVSFKWAFDFDEAFKTATAIFPGAAIAGEWNIGEWNLAEFGGGTKLNEKCVAGRGFGEYIKVGFTALIDGSPISIQQLAMYAKQGRIK